ncbi:MAG: sulfate adenylyltransferase subunit CysN [Bdellovibrionales bacterium]|nr:sulfate adenylyltransferase subunit CysN [Bdellovibrionales bacterium]
MDLLRFTTAGSVDDGKSTLIGRLLFDSKSIFQDQMEALEKSSALRGEEGVNLALLTDGLRSEREQGITIDVAYRYFSTPKRKFIIADTPGHEQYTRNMVTGASTANLAIIIIDARNGVSTQSRRHGVIASLLGIPHLIVAINKMDLVDYSEEVYEKIVDEYSEFSRKLGIHDMSFIPISALNGDNVVNPSENMPWYQGQTVLYQLENVSIASDKNLIDFRFPVQTVIRPDQNFRGYAGLIESGTLQIGEEVTALPSQQQSKVKDILFYGKSLNKAIAGQSVIITLEDERDISRGDMIVRKSNVPQMTNEFEAIVCWMDDKKNLNTQTKYILRHTTNQVDAFVSNIEYEIDVNTLHRKSAEDIDLNSIARVSLTTAAPIFCDPYKINRSTGSFVLIDPNSNLTVAAGMIRARSQAKSRKIESKRSSNIVLDEGLVPLSERESKNGHKAMIFWLTGLSGSGKSTIAKAVERKLFEAGKSVVRIDGDNLRDGICGDLGFGARDRKENIRRASEAARLLYHMGHVVICSFVSPFSEDRDYAKSVVPEGKFHEVFVDCPLEECIQRDVKGLYKRAMAGEILDFTGVSSPYNRPENPEVLLETQKLSEQEAVEKLESYILEAIK